MDKLKYVTFDLALAPSRSDSYRARAWDSLGRHARPVEVAGLGKYLADEATVEDPQTIGGELFRAVFQSEVLTCFQTSRADSLAQGLGLRIRLRLNEVPELANLPWETLYDSDRDLHFALSVETPIVRYLELPEPAPPLSVAKPLEILVVSASPQDHDPIEVSAEWQLLNNSLQDLSARGRVRLHHLEHGSLQALQTWLRRGSFHVFHFIGHAGFLEKAQDGALFFEDSDRQSHRVHARELAVLLRDHRTLRLAVINACEGARASHLSPFLGIAPRLVRHGIPAVVAMRTEIDNPTACSLAEKLYDGLADGFPVDASLSESRKAVFREGDASWSIPVLFMRSEDGVLFDRGPASPSEEGEPEPPEHAPDAVEAAQWLEQKKIADSQELGQVFISYRHAPSDTRLAKALDTRLRELGLKVFLDQRIEVGTRWVEVIDRAIRDSSYFVAILSPESIRSDMVRQEIALAHQLELEGAMRILPIRATTLCGQLPYDLASYLDPIQYTLWDPAWDPDSTCWVIASAILGMDLPKLAAESIPQVFNQTPTEDSEGAPLPVADPRTVIEQGAESGAVRLSSPFYVEREADRRMEMALRRKGRTLVVKGMRQSGKSSLLARAIALVRRQGQRTVYLDFQTLENAQLESCSRLLYTLALRIHSALRTPLKPQDVWDDDIGAKQSFAEFLEQAVLESGDAPVLLALDEVDRIFTRPYRADFFSAVRSWHSNRAIHEEMWSKLDLAIAHATDPTLWIDDLNQSPFNVGERLRLEGFSCTEIADLNQRYRLPLRGPVEVEQLHQLVGGQPYLVRQALWVLVSNSWTLVDLRRVALDDDGPFGDHLRHHLWVLHNNPRLQAVVQQLTEQKGCEDELDYQRLLAAGLLKGEVRSEATLLCDLYVQYFRSHL